MQENENATALFELMTMLNQIMFDPKMIQNVKLSKNELLILSLVRNTDKIMMSALATAIGTSPAQITRSVTSLENKKLVQRRINPKNRRVINVTLTVQGAALFAQHEQAVQLKLQQRLAHISTMDYKELNHALQQAVSILKHSNLTTNTADRNNVK
ncbi:MarR family winged helix-turn-helix transcriptional regulator [Loigolactobacillus binensis]|uniref:MarR family winged helix-turn-helix transcriptional regulator n=1 Tax=Loigolactobacillus binensis TaxID=2559922 RepID=A0ABW3ED69_9LACO|nr:MarR family transcriptional regulator [Loigolactobacillus binensis]